MTQGEEISVNGARAGTPGDGNLFCGVVAVAGTQGSDISPRAAAAVAAKTSGKDISAHGMVRTSGGDNLVNGTHARTPGDGILFHGAG